MTPGCSLVPIFPVEASSVKGLAGNSLEFVDHTLSVRAIPLCPERAGAAMGST